MCLEYISFISNKFVENDARNMEQSVQTANTNMFYLMINVSCTYLREMCIIGFFFCISAPCTYTVHRNFFHSVALSIIADRCRNIIWYNQKTRSRSFFIYDNVNLILQSVSLRHVRIQIRDI